MIFPNVQFAAPRSPSYLVQLDHAAADRGGRPHISGDQHWSAFAASFGYHACGRYFAMWLPVRKRPARGAAHARRLPCRCTVSGSCSGASARSPFILAQSPVLDWPDAVFESISGLTTTAAAALPSTWTICRHRSSFTANSYSGSGASGSSCSRVAVLPMLGVGGMQAILRGAPRTDQRYEAHPADHADGEAALVPGFRHDGGVRCLLLAGWHVRVRCDLP